MKHIDPNRLVSLTKELMDIESVSRNEAELLGFIRKALSPDLEVAYDDGDVLLVTTERSADKKFVVIAGHTDTVPIEDNFPSKQEGNVIYGRGASDMKGGLAVMIELANWIVGLPSSDFDYGFLFFAREELPSSDSALLPALEASEAIRSADFAILMEPSSNVVELGCSGNINLSLTYSGKATHSARPWNGDNAIHKAIRHLQEIALGEITDVIIDDLLFREVANITNIEGGTAKNVIPAQARVSLNIRYAPNRKPQEIETEWVSLMKAEGVAVEVEGHAPPAPVVLNHDITQRLMNAGANGPASKQAWTNAADFAMFGVPAINFGPGDSKYAHSKDEQITTEALVECIETLSRFVTGDNK